MLFRSIADFHLAVQTAFFRQIPEATPRALVDGAIVPGNAACVDRIDADNHAHRGRFAGSVRTQKSERGTARDAKRHISNGLYGAKLFANPIDLEHYGILLAVTFEVSRRPAAMTIAATANPT